jgi:hypothetical protein
MWLVWYTSGRGTSLAVSKSADFHDRENFCVLCHTKSFAIMKLPPSAWRSPRIWQSRNASRSPPNASPPEPDEEYVLVSVKEIETIHVNKPKSDQGKAPVVERQAPSER